MTSFSMQKEGVKANRAEQFVRKLELFGFEGDSVTYDTAVGH